MLNHFKDTAILAKIDDEKTEKNVTLAFPQNLKLYIAKSYRDGMPVCHSKQLHTLQTSVEEFESKDGVVLRWNTGNGWLFGDVPWKSSKLTLTWEPLRDEIVNSLATSSISLVKNLTLIISNWIWRDKKYHWLMDESFFTGCRIDTCKQKWDFGTTTPQLAT